MDNMMQTCLIVALSFAVFSAVATVGASLALGIGFERLRAGYEVIRKQSGYFSDQIYKLDKRVDTLEKNDPMLPAGIVSKDQPMSREDKPAYLSIDSGLIAQARQEQSLGVSFDAPSASGQRYLLEGDVRPEGIRFH
jgi:hypothetical protein